MKYTVEYRTSRYISVTVEADSSDDALGKAEAGIQWGYEPTSDQFEIHHASSKEWEINDIREEETS